MKHPDQEPSGGKLAAILKKLLGGNGRSCGNRYTRAILRRDRHAEYRLDEKARNRASMKAQKLTNNVYDPCWADVN